MLNAGKVSLAATIANEANMITALIRAPPVKEGALRNAFLTLT
ncbi:MAG: hypothetical protein AAF666_08000 [Pseudomonadota bacterium]